MPDVEVPVTPAPAAPVVAEAPRRFEIPVLTELKAEDAPTDAPKAESPPATEEKPPEVAKDPEAEAAAKARSDRQKQNRLYKQLAEEKVRRETAERERDALRKPAEPVRDGAPDPAQFTDIGEYTKAVREHERTEAIKEHEQKQQAKASETQQNQLVEGWNKASDIGAEKYEDFDQVVGELKPNSPWTIAIMRSENAADVAYYLGTNMKEAQRIIALDPVSQILEVGRLSAKLLSTPPAPKLASKAPAPISPVGGVAVPETGITDGMEFSKFVKMRNKQLGRK